MPFTPYRLMTDQQAGAALEEFLTERPTGEVWQVYGAGGELLAEYAPNGAPNSPQTPPQALRCCRASSGPPGPGTPWPA